jgi:hypothetical protein
VQVDPIKPKLKPPGTKPLKLKCDIMLSNIAFKFNLRCYREDERRGVSGDSWRRWRRQGWTNITTRDITRRVDGVRSRRRRRRRRRGTEAVISLGWLGLTDNA